MILRNLSMGRLKINGNQLVVLKSCFPLIDFKINSPNVFSPFIGLNDDCSILDVRFKKGLLAGKSSRN